MFRDINVSPMSRATTLRLPQLNAPRCLHEAFAEPLLHLETAAARLGTLGR